jgi:ABC-type antimicrobial peptide transport system permease subunit
LKKPLFATLLGGVLGIFDGLTALFTPEVRNQIVGIVIGSTIKGILTGVIIGFFATKVRSLAIGTIFGLVVGAFFAYLILLMNPGHTLNIMLPGSLVGVIVGYAAQKHQRL